VLTITIHAGNPDLMKHNMLCQGMKIIQPAPGCQVDFIHT